MKLKSRDTDIHEVFEIDGKEYFRHTEINSYHNHISWSKYEIVHKFGDPEPAYPYQQQTRVNAEEYNYLEKEYLKYKRTLKLERL